MKSNFPLDNKPDMKQDPILPRLAWQERRDWIKQQLIKTRKALEEAERKMLQK